MSRIHEALQRAYLERGRTPVLADLQVAQPDVEPAPPQLSPDLDEPPIAKAEFVLEDIARQTWKPMLTSFPTLADRGAG